MNTNGLAIRRSRRRIPGVVRSAWMRWCAVFAAAVVIGHPGIGAAATPVRPDIWGVWIGIDREDTTADPKFRNTPWLPKPEMTPWGAEEAKRWDTPLTPGECNPFNPAWFMNAGALFPIEILQGPNLILMSYEATNVPRRIYTDGRGHPPDLDPTWLGHSIAHWEGDTLVIDTIGTNGRAKPLNGFPAGGVSDTAASAKIPRLPASDKLHLVERIRLVGGGDYLEDELTVTDLKTYTAPFSSKHYWRRRSDIDMQEYFCSDFRRRDAEGQEPPGGPGPAAP